MVGVSYPERFVVGREPSPAERSVADRQGYAYPHPYVYSYGYDYPFGYRDYYSYGSYYRPIYTTYYDTPVRVSGRQKEVEVPHGKMVNGQGYTRTRPSDHPPMESGSRAGSTDSRSSGGSSKSGGSSGSGSSGSGSSSGSSSGRTAHKKGG
jgi:hypothetical protein